jgi:hypothetical protein
MDWIGLDWIAYPGRGWLTGSRKEDYESTLLSSLDEIPYPSSSP